MGPADRFAGPHSIYKALSPARRSSLNNNANHPATRTPSKPKVPTTPKPERYTTPAERLGTPDSSRQPPKPTPTFVSKTDRFELPGGLYTSYGGASLAEGPGAGDYTPSDALSARVRGAVRLQAAVRRRQSRGALAQLDAARAVPGVGDYEPAEAGSRLRPGPAETAAFRSKDERFEGHGYYAAAPGWLLDALPAPPPAAPEPDATKQSAPFASKTERFEPLVKSGKTDLFARLETPSQRAPAPDAYAPELFAGATTARIFAGGRIEPNPNASERPPPSLELATRAAGIGPMPRPRPPSASMLARAVSLDIVLADLDEAAGAAGIPVAPEEAAAAAGATGGAEDGGYVPFNASPEYAEYVPFRASSACEKEAEEEYEEAEAVRRASNSSDGEWLFSQLERIAGAAQVSAEDYRDDEGGWDVDGLRSDLQIHMEKLARTRAPRASPPRTRSRRSASERRP